jgi:hypothetical protein
VSDDEAFAVGLPCGDSIEVFVQRAGLPELPRLAELVAAGTPVALLTVVEGVPGRLGRRMVVTEDSRLGSLGFDRVDDAAAVDDGRGLLAFAIASNESCSGWTKTFTDPRLGAAIVGRLTFGGNIIETGPTPHGLAHARQKHLAGAAG